jgi:hypothetical protein
MKNLPETLLYMASNSRNQEGYHPQRMNLPPSAQQMTAPQWLAAHIDSTMRKLRSYLQYVGLAKCVKAIETLPQLQEIKLTWFDLISEIHAFLSCSQAMTILFLSPANVKLLMHKSAHSAFPT